MIQRHKNRLPQSVVCQGAVEIHIGVASANACGGGNIKALVCFQLLQIAGGGDIFHQIHVPALERHGLGGAVLDEKDRNGIVGNFSVPVILIAGEFGAYTGLHAIQLIRAGADDALLHHRHIDH